MTSLPHGARFGRYEIEAHVGASDTGDLYQARDTKPDRDVALMVLPDEIAHDPESLSRLEAEIRILASLNHPNIAAISGLERAGGQLALVLEPIDAPTLAERIARGPIPLEEALPIARQIADALEAALEAGVIHGDLTPSNVRVSADGTVKVTGIGVAPAIDAAHRDERRPPRTPADTRVPVGTAAYLSPEQVRGMPRDKRADTWAFGCLLYEMLTGRRAFRGGAISQTLAKVLETLPDLDALPKDTPEPVRQLLQRCLEKNGRQRLQHIGDARVVIEQIAPDAGDAKAETTPRRHRKGRRFTGLGVAVIAAVALGVTFWIWPVPDQTRGS